MTNNRGKILVTGGAGFIGLHTAVSLAEAGYEPILVDNFSNSDKAMLDGLKAILGRSLPLHEGDCADKAFMLDVMHAEGPFFGAIHFAAHKAVGESVEQPLRYYQNNINALITLVDVLIASGCPRLVFSSSATVYGNVEELPVTESSPRRPAQSPYGNTKKIAEEILEDVCTSGAPLNTIALRYFNPIGAHPSARIGELPLGIPNNLIPFVCQAAAGQREQITIFGNDYDTPDGTCIRDYINIMDLAEAHVATLDRLAKIEETTSFDALNIGTGAGTSVMEVLKTFEEVNTLKLNTHIGPRRAGDIASVYANVSKAEEQLGWKASRSLEDSLRSAWTWQQALDR